MIRKLTDADRSSIRDYIRQGLSTPEIMIKMRNLYSHQQIAAVRAHLTMESRNYQRPVKKSCLNTLTPAHRYTIVNLIRRGLKTTHIIREMKYIYSQQQIAAVRAHLTMGTYGR